MGRTTPPPTSTALYTHTSSCRDKKYHTREGCYNCFCTEDMEGNDTQVQRRDHSTYTITH